MLGTLTHWVLAWDFSLYAALLVAGSGLIGGVFLPAPYRPLLKLGGLLSLLIAAYLAGYQAADDRATVASLRQEKATLERDLAAQKLSAEFYAKWVKDLESQTADKEKEIAAYELDLKSRPNNACLLTPDDLGVRDKKR
jgi:cell division protein FtsB